MRKVGMVAVLVAAFLATPLFAGMASAGDGTNSGTITPVVEQGTTDRLGGGDWVVVHAGNTNFGVVYGTESNKNKVYIVADYKRYIAGVDFYDAQGNLLRTKGVPVWNVFAQSFDRLVEFRDADGNHRFDMRQWDESGMGGDMPVKGLNLIQAWTLSGLTQETSNKVLFVNFTLSISNKTYTWKWNEMLKRPEMVLPPSSLGEVQRVALTFHIKVGVEDATAEIPWFNVVISGGDERRIQNRSFDGWREFTGQKVNMSVKYDHSIQGWDFASNESNLLLETHMIYGRVVPREMVEQYRMRSGSLACSGDCRQQDAEIGGESGEISKVPRTIQAPDRHGTITFADDWDRVGRFTWKSDVTVDGQNEDMYFQVYGGGPYLFEYAHAASFGMSVVGAFVYPAGESIFHDPGFEAASYEFGIPTITNLAPQTVLFLQLVVVLAAIVGAVLLRARRKGQQ